MNNRIPFTIENTESFYDKLSEWIGDLFYDILPEAGFRTTEMSKFIWLSARKGF